MINCDKKYVANIIKNARKRKGLKQAELAEIIGISEKHLSKIETGKNYPALDNFLRLIDVLEISLNDFGVSSKNNESPTRLKLEQIINVSSDKQINLYLEILTALYKNT